MKSMIQYKTFKCEDCQDQYQGSHPYTYEGKIVCTFCQVENYEA